MKLQPYIQIQSTIKQLLVQHKHMLRIVYTQPTQYLEDITGQSLRSVNRTE